MKHFSGSTTEQIALGLHSILVAGFKSQQFYAVIHIITGKLYTLLYTLGISTTVQFYLQFFNFSLLYKKFDWPHSTWKHTIPWIPLDTGSNHTHYNWGKRISFGVDWWKNMPVAVQIVHLCTRNCRGGVATKKLNINQVHDSDTYSYKQFLDCNLD